MNAHTHMLGGMVAGAAVSLFGSSSHLLMLITTAVLTSPLPSVAAVHGHVEPYRRGPWGNTGLAHGHVGRVTPFGIVWHRGPFHSAAALVFWMAAAAVVGSLSFHTESWTGALVLGTAVGVLSHLLLDALNIMRQAWL